MQNLVLSRRGTATAGVLYLEYVCDVGVARSNPSPIKLGVVPVMEDERRRVDEEEIRKPFIERREIVES
jgi:hypothetical protein